MSVVAGRGDTKASFCSQWEAKNQVNHKMILVSDMVVWPPLKKHFGGYLVAGSDREGEIGDAGNVGATVHYHIVT